MSWSLECKENALEVLPTALYNLYCQLGIIMDTIDDPPVYNGFLSRITQKLGECKILAEIAEEDDLSRVLDGLASLLRELFVGINFDGVMSDIVIVYDNINNILTDYKLLDERSRVVISGFK